MAMTEIDREFDLTLDTLGPDWFARFAKMGIPTRVTLVYVASTASVGSSQTPAAFSSSMRTAPRP
jgi:hypothetical protein